MKRTEKINRSNFHEERTRNRDIKEFNIETDRYKDSKMHVKKRLI